MSLNRKARITKRSVDSLSDGAGDAFLWDSDIPGFGLRRRTSGAKSYFLQYRTEHGRLRWMTIGRHGAPWTPEEARNEALRLLGRVKHGEDPADDRETRRKDLSVSELCDLYMAQPIIITRKGTAKKASSLATDRSNIERHIKVLLGSRRVRTLSRDDVEQFQKDVAAGKTKADIKTKKQGRAVVKGGKGTAARSVAVLEAVMTFAVSKGLRTGNPVTGVVLFKNNRRERFLRVDGFASVGDGLRRYEDEGGNIYAAAAVRLLLLSGCRRSEILTLRDDAVDDDRGILWLADSKTGRRPVIVSRLVIDIVRSLPRLAGNPYVLPGQKEGIHLSSIQKAWHTIRTYAGLPGLRLHDLRHNSGSRIIPSTAGELA
jgi:integrase